MYLLHDVLEIGIVFVFHMEEITSLRVWKLAKCRE